MRRQKCLLSVLLFSWLCFATFSSVLAVPPLPSSFYGKVKVNGANVPVGTEVTAWIDGVRYAFTTTIMNEGESVYSFDVPGDDPSTLDVIEGGTQGQAIVFRIGNLVAHHSAIWQSGTYENHDLFAGEGVDRDYLVFLPLVLK